MLLGVLPQARAEIADWAEHCEEQADRLQQEAVQERSKAFRTWAEKATQNGGGAAHAYTKVPVGWKEAVVPGGAHPSRTNLGSEGVSSDPQKVVEAELAKWCGGRPQESRPGLCLRVQSWSSWHPP